LIKEKLKNITLATIREIPYLELNELPQKSADEENQLEILFLSEKVNINIYFKYIEKN
jgi:hypothetical protein